MDGFSGMQMAPPRTGAGYKEVSATDVVIPAVRKEVGVQTGRFTHGTTRFSSSSPSCNRQRRGV